MALDPRIALAGQVTDVAGAIQSGQKITGNSMRIALQRQNQQINAMGIAQKQAQYTNNLFTSLRDKPLDERAAIMAQNMGVLEQYGIPPSELMGNLDDAGIDRVLAATQPFMQIDDKGSLKPTAGMQDFAFYESIIANPNSSPDAVRAARIKQGVEASEGTIKATRPVKMPDGTYRVFDPTTSTFGNVVEVASDGQLSEVSPEEQLQDQGSALRQIGVAETDVLVDRETELRPGKLQTQEELDQLSLQTSAKATAEQIRQTKASTLRTEMAERNRSAARNRIKINEAMTLAKNSDTEQGVMGVAAVKLSQLLPGIDVSNEAALDSALKGLALDQLQQFKGQTTDFEYGIVSDISGSLMGSREANIARIAALERNSWFLSKEFQQYNDFVFSGGDPDEFAFNFEEVVETSKGDFTLREIQEAAANASVSIEEAIFRLNQ